MNPLRLRISWKTTNNTYGLQRLLIFSRFKLLKLKVVVPTNQLQAAVHKFNQLQAAVHQFNQLQAAAHHVNQLQAAVHQVNQEMFKTSLLEMLGWLVVTHSRIQVKYSTSLLLFVKILTSLCLMKLKTSGQCSLSSDGWTQLVFSQWERL